MKNRCCLQAKLIPPASLPSHLPGTTTYHAILRRQNGALFFYRSMCVHMSKLPRVAVFRIRSMMESIPFFVLVIFSRLNPSKGVINVFTTGSPFLATKLLGFSIGRGFGALKGLSGAPQHAQSGLAGTKGCNKWAPRFKSAQDIRAIGTQER